MRIAVLIGVSDYKENGYLPSVENDVRAMERLLRATGRYEDPLVLSGDLLAEPTKREIIEFLKPFWGKRPDEIFFYYSGHGHVLDGRLIFPMSNWQRKHERSTSIQNDELDRWLRKLNPALTVKVLDCCYAGVRYVKGLHDMKELVEPREGAFEDLYFFLSSRSDQTSVAGDSDSLSLYTDRFLKALSSLEDGPVRYQQLIDRIHESFRPDEQEPQFTVQGGVGHIFCELNQDIRAALEWAGPSDLAEPEDQVGDSVEPAVDLRTSVQQDAQRCISLQDAKEVLTALETQTRGLSMEDLEPYYDVELRIPDWSDWLADDYPIAGQIQIGRWFKKHPGFFGRAIEEVPRRPNPSFANSSEWLYRREPFVTGFVTDAPVPFDRLQIMAVPQYPNLRQWEFAALIVWSVRRAVVFSYSIPISPSSWDEFQTPEDAPWKQISLSIENLKSLPSLVLDQIHGFRQSALDDVAQIVE